MSVFGDNFNLFKPHFEYQPSGDQPQAIDKLCQNVEQNVKDQVLLGVTGSGKTFTMANVIARTNRPTVIMAHNKTLAAQLYNEMKEFFPENAVEYFVSYYDYYQPEAYVAKTNTYIEKESSINEQIDRMRHSATRSLLERRDVIVVSSVSCIYGIGSAETYSRMTFDCAVGDTISPQDLARRLTELQYKRNDHAFFRGTFRIKGDTFDIYPAHFDERAWRLSFFGDELESILEFDPLTGQNFTSWSKITIFPNSHYVIPKPTVHQAISSIKQELAERLIQFEQENKLLEKQRLEERTRFDLEMLTTTGFCSGIENYSRHLTGRNPGEAPPTLFEYLPADALLFVDESHVTIPQIGAMYKGDFARKNNLSEYGFRLPSCIDNRPLKFDEWNTLRPTTVYVSATPAPWEIEQTQGEVIEQVVRPTGLLDPICEIRPVITQVDDLIHECQKVIAEQGRILVTTLTKRMAEDLTNYMVDAGLKVKYLHSDIDTIERVEILRALRLGEFDILIGINLLREGLDIPECCLVAILDADKEGFLRSKTSLIQTIGRAARHPNGRVILYADTITASMRYALDETARRRQKQQDYNTTHNITPQALIKKISLGLLAELGESKQNAKNKKGKIKDDISALMTEKELNNLISRLKKEMTQAAENLEFEKAATLRDQLKKAELMLLDRLKDPLSS